MLNSGLLAKGVVKNNIIDKVYTLSNNHKYIKTHVIFVNTGTTPANVRMYVTNKTTPTTEDAVEYDVSVIPNGRLERTCVELQLGESIFLSTTSNTLTYRITGVDDEAGLQTSWVATDKKVTLTVYRADINKNLTATVSYIMEDGTYTVDQNVKFGTTDNYGNMVFSYTPTTNYLIIKVSIWVYMESIPITRVSFNVDSSGNLTIA